jgi:hypothetical protein
MRLPTIRRRTSITGLPDRAAGHEPGATRRNFTIAGIVAMTACFVGGVVALVTGTLPSDRILGNTGIDLGVALLFVPLCALVFVLVAEAVRAVAVDRDLRVSRGKSPDLGAWHPGVGEG